MNNNYVTIGKFAEQIARQIKNPNDIVTAIGTWSGFDREHLYTLYCKDENGNEYEINIDLENKEV